MQIVEQFFSLQGEGKYLGVPSLFVRTNFCNLRCAWRNKDGSITKCDTPYASWYKTKTKNVTSGEIILNAIKHKVNHIVITGGEPLLQEDIVKIVNDLVKKNFIVTIETNGTRFIPQLTTNVFLSISPKLKTSYAQKENTIEWKIHRTNNMYIDNLYKYINRSKKFQVKFVYNNDSDIIEIEKIRASTGLLAKYVYLMPQGKTAKQVKANSKKVFEYCMKNKYNYSPRLHIDVWGSKRGI